MYLFILKNIATKGKLQFLLLEVLFCNTDFLQIRFQITYEYYLDYVDKKIIFVSFIWFIIIWFITNLSTLKKIIYATHLFLPPFSWAELKDLRILLYTQNAYFSQILFTNLYKSVLVSTSPLLRKFIHLTGVAYQDAD